MTVGLLEAFEAEFDGMERVRPQSGWSTRTRPGSFGAGVVMEHWSAAFSSPENPAPSLRVVINGLARPDLGYFLPGPLYHVLIGYDGIARIIHKGLGNHAGRGSLAAYNLARRGEVPYDYRPGPDTNVLNGRAWGVCLDYHPAQGEPPRAMLDGAIRATVAIHRYMGWKTLRVFDHRHATRRKIDNQGIPDLRPAMAERLEDDMASHVIPYAKPHPDARFVRKQINYFFTFTAEGGPPGTNWLPDSDVFDDRALDALMEAFDRMRRPGFVGPVAYMDLLEEELNHAHIIANGLSPTVVSALNGAIAAAYAQGFGRSRPPVA